MEEKSYRVIDKMFRTAGWDVVTLKFGKQLLRAFDAPGGHVRMRTHTCVWPVL